MAQVSPHATLALLLFAACGQAARHRASEHGDLALAHPFDLDCGKACEEAYEGDNGMSYKGSCKQYCVKAVEGKDPCDTCKYVPDSSGYNKACQFFMTAFVSSSKVGCYLQRLNAPSCPEEMYMQDACEFVGWEALREAKRQGLLVAE
mmetsp:Transcript_9117/g.21289  ORF Transcript_9117/g.21289 Transcript_9117/m.21289 type:complete len:148 (-) Transcript_9117:101-544(-)